MGSWAAVVDCREEDGYQIAATRELAIAAAMESLVEAIDCGHDDAGTWELEVVEGCVWHQRCTDDGCDYCPSGEWEQWLHDYKARHRVTVEVYAVPDDDPPEYWSHDYREVSDVHPEV